MAETAGPDPSTDRVNLLLVDDHPENLVALEAILDHPGHRLLKAHSGMEALRHLLTEEVAVILLDVQMPNMNGLETARMIRERDQTRSTPIIFVTAADPSHQLEVQGYEMGAVDYIFKPFNPEILRAKVDVFIDLYRKSRQIQRMNKALQRANDELRAFSYSVSHDLRAPLRKIQSFGEILFEEDGDELPDRTRDHLERIVAASSEMNEMIDDLLLLSLVSREDLDVDHVDLSAIAREILEDLQHGEPERTVEVVVQRGVQVEGDERMLQLALRNLLGNAWKYTGRTEQPRIEFGCQEERGVPVCFVRDNGAGFDMAEARHLFRPFHRLHAKSDFPGTGIGLAIVDRVIRRHGGRVWAESTTGQGATFYFRLPSDPD